MANDASSGIKDWEEKFWTLGGLLDSKKPKAKDSDPNKDPYVIEEQRKAMDSFRKLADRKPLGSKTKSSKTKKRKATPRKRM